MTIGYKEDEILKKENWMYGKPLIGYINPSGQILDYSMLIGPYGHDNWRNPATSIFLSFVSFVVKNYKVAHFLEYEWDKEKTLYKNNKYEGFDDVVKRGLEYIRSENYESYDNFLQYLDSLIVSEKESAIWSAKNKYFSDRNVYKILSYDLAKLFEKLYSNRDFFDSLGRILSVENYEDV